MKGALGSSAGSLDRVSGDHGKPPPTPVPLPHVAVGGGSADGHSLEGASLSAWRYASVADSADSDSYHAQLAVDTGNRAAGTGAGAAAQRAGGDTGSWRTCTEGATAAASRAAAAPAPPAVAASVSFAAPLGSSMASGSGAGAGDEPGSGGNRQLWSPDKQQQQQRSAFSGHKRSGSPARLAATVAGLQQQQPMSASAGSATLQTFVPPGMDAASYAAGERAAFLRAFQQALPGQQALGQLFSAVDALHGRLEEETQQWRQLQLGATKTAGMVETALQRLDTVEFMRLPQLQEKWEELACREPERLVEVLAGLQEVLGLLAQQRQQLMAQPWQQQQQGVSGGSRQRSLLVRQMHWMLLAVTGYGQSVLSKADVAALLLSRKILLTDLTEEGGRFSQAARSALGALLFVASVEGAWHAQRRLLRRLPGFAQRMAAPAQLGLRVARVAVWSAALVLAVAQTRNACQSASDSVCSAAEAAARALRLPARLQALLWLRWGSNGAGAAAVPQQLACCQVHAAQAAQECCAGAANPCSCSPPAAASGSSGGDSGAASPTACTA